jgi:hypothetical protein
MNLTKENRVPDHQAQKVIPLLHRLREEKENITAGRIAKSIIESEEGLAAPQVLRHKVRNTVIVEKRLKKIQLRPNLRKLSKLTQRLFKSRKNRNQI